MVSNYDRSVWPRPVIPVESSLWTERRRLSPDDRSWPLRNEPLAATFATGGSHLAVTIVAVGLMPAAWLFASRQPHWHSCWQLAASLWTPVEYQLNGTRHEVGIAAGSKLANAVAQNRRLSDRFRPALVVLLRDRRRLRSLVLLRGIYIPYRDRRRSTIPWWNITVTRMRNTKPHWSDNRGRIHRYFRMRCNQVSRDERINLPANSNSLSIQSTQ